MHIAYIYTPYCILHSLCVHLFIKTSVITNSRRKPCDAGSPTPQIFSSSHLRRSTQDLKTQIDRGIRITQIGTHVNNGEERASERGRCGLPDLDGGRERSKGVLLCYRSKRGFPALAGNDSNSGSNCGRQRRQSYRPDIYSWAGGESKADKREGERRRAARPPNEKGEKKSRS